ncbi:MAG TPA: polysaccharide biosynthesis/export family protein [Gemmatimonadaceae bacterium]
MLRFFRVAFALAGLFAAPQLVAQVGTAQPDQANTAIISPGDQIRILVYRQPELSGDFQVAANGTLIHPLYRDVQVTGVPLTVVEDRLRTFLTKFVTNPQFVIQPLVKVIVGGEVKSPNVYAVPPETTVQQVVAMAGGPTDRGKMDEVHMVRDRQEIRVDLSRADTDAALLQIRSGDVILVGRQGAGFRDFIGPFTSTIAAVATLYALFTR